MGCLKQGAEGYALTWMDAKVDEWVVTPRRGKAVEINGSVVQRAEVAGGMAGGRGRSRKTPARVAKLAQKRVIPSTRDSGMNRGKHLFDVIDGPEW